MAINIPLIRGNIPLLPGNFVRLPKFTLSLSSLAGKTTVYFAGCIELLIPISLATASPLFPADDTGAHTGARFVPLGNQDARTPAINLTSPSRCIVDRKTHLVWEIKSNINDAQNKDQTYSWYSSNSKNNGGFAGYRNKGHCKLASCDTQSYIDYINQKKLCGVSSWRLPSREELRSIVDYEITYPGPTIDTQSFPNTVSQFYWSSTPSANDKDSAWGVGFSFGYDYAYFKSDHGYVRLVSGP